MIGRQADVLVHVEDLDLPPDFRRGAGERNQRREVVVLRGRAGHDDACATLAGDDARQLGLHKLRRRRAHGGAISMDRGARPTREWKRNRWGAHGALAVRREGTETNLQWIARS